jgi:hypothetical protein
MLVWRIRKYYVILLQGDQKKLRSDVTWRWFALIGTDSCNYPDHPCRILRCYAYVSVDETKNCAIPDIIIGCDVQLAGCGWRGALKWRLCIIMIAVIWRRWSTRNKLKCFTFAGAQRRPCNSITPDTIRHVIADWKPRLHFSNIMLNPLNMLCEYKRLHYFVYHSNVWYTV